MAGYILRRRGLALMRVIPSAAIVSAVCACNADLGGTDSCDRDTGVSRVDEDSGIAPDGPVEFSQALVSADDGSTFLSAACSNYAAVEVRLSGGAGTPLEGHVEFHALRLVATPPPSYSTFLASDPDDSGGDWQSTQFVSNELLLQSTVVFHGTGPTGQEGCLACGPEASMLCGRVEEWREEWPTVHCGE